ncbi:MAG: MATE family efflux transporter [Lachnospiraceae bacterium]|nr:MATE family efflux transporter [Lachnospiraceae bacterium]
MEQKNFELNGELQNSENVIVENKMGVMPVNKLLISMSLPMMVSMLVQALYNIVDSLFVARISEDALSAVSLAFPIQTLMIALSGGTAVGLGTLLSRALGEKNHKRVSAIATNGVFLISVIYAIFLIIGLFAIEPFFASQTKDAEIMKYGVEYLRVVCICSIGLCCQMIFEKLLQSTGKTTLSMVTQLIGAVINIILDPIFIFGYFGVPKMGVAGAAIATVIGQIIAAIVAILLNFKKNTEIKFEFKGFRPSSHIIGQIYVIGIPSIIMQSIGSVMVYGMNQILMAFTSTATAVFGAYFKLQSFIFMPIFGLNNGLVPIIAYNYGARKRERVIKAIKLGMIYAVSIMFVGIIVFQLIPDVLLNMFDASEQMLAIGIPALRIISLHFVFAGFCIIAGSACQALGNAVYSMITSICRQLLVLLPAAYLLSKLGDVNYVWWAFPIAELVSVVLNIGFLTRTNKKVLRPMKETED